jgi:hypothetical protein
MAKINATPDEGFVDFKPSRSVKSAETNTDIEQTDYVRYQVSEEEIQNLLLQDIGGRELITLTRHDQINGIAQDYSPIKNASELSLQYNPVEISKNQNSLDNFTDLFYYNLNEYVPSIEELELFYPNNEEKRKTVYFDNTLNSITIHIANAFNSEQVEIEFLSFDEVKDDTIYGG